MNDTPKANKLHIGIFGKRNAGKSTLMNAILGQEMSIVSPVAGTTTDIVWKSMELHQLGAVVFVDTPGVDDEGELGDLRVSKTKRALEEVDVIVWVTKDKLDSTEKDYITQIRRDKIPFILVYNIQSGKHIERDKQRESEFDTVYVNAKTGEQIDELKVKLSVMLSGKKEKLCLGDCLSEGDLVLLVAPQDIQAPKGRLILPQVQILREVLDARAIPIMTTMEKLETTLRYLKVAPQVAVVDSQLFGVVEKYLPKETKITSFSIAMARQKGDLKVYVEGVNVIGELKDKDRILIVESCTHTPLHGDIAREKIPMGLMKKTDKRLYFDFIRGTDFPIDLKEYKLVVLCGGCMQTPAQIQSKIKKCVNQQVAVTNFGVLLAYLNGTLERSIEIIF